jgi:hypothetical protein
MRIIIVHSFIRKKGGKRRGDKQAIINNFLKILKEIAAETTIAVTYIIRTCTDVEFESPYIDTHEMHPQSAWKNLNTDIMDNRVGTYVASLYPNRKRVHRLRVFLSAAGCDLEIHANDDNHPIYIHTNPRANAIQSPRALIACITRSRKLQRVLSNVARWHKSSCIIGRIIAQNERINRNDKRGRHAVDHRKRCSYLIII